MKCVPVSKLWLRQRALPSSLAPEDVGKKKKNIHEQSMNHWKKKRKKKRKKKSRPGVV